MKTQIQLFYEAHRKIADLNAAFMELVNHPTNPMTRQDLESLIARRPDTYGRFAGFLDQLPSAAPPKPAVDPLDKLLAEQAATYGMTPAQFARTMSDLASVQEKIEACDFNYLDRY